MPRNGISSMSLVLEYENWSKRVVEIRIGVVMWIFCPMFEIELKFESGLTLINILNFGAQISFFYYFNGLDRFSAKNNFSIFLMLQCHIDVSSGLR